MKILTKANGEKLYHTLMKGESVDSQALCEEDDSRLPEPLEVLRALSEGSSELIDRFSGGIPKGRDSEFDGLAAEMIHQAIGDRLDLVSMRSFWCRLSFVELFPLVQLRHPGQNRPLADSENYALGTPRNGFLFRSWLRGDIGHDPYSTDVYRLARLGDDVDFWRSHILRVDYGGCRTFARAFIRFVLDPEAPYFRQLDRAGMRKLAKVVNRRYRNMPLNVMSEHESVAFLNDLAGAN